jgi:hypothetical protein
MGNNIFINYRRDDTGGIAIAMYRELENHFPPETLFKDFNTIKPGYDFVESINNALTQCNVLLVLIGKNWLSVKDEDGNPRLFKEDDYVRMEIARCLSKNIPVIPVLLDRVRMPLEAELPDELKSLRRRQSISIDNEGFEQDMQRLVAAIREITGIVEPKRQDFPNPQPNNPAPVVGEKPKNYRVHAIVAIVFSVLCLFNIGASTVQGIGLIMGGFAGYCLSMSMQIDKNWNSGNKDKALALSSKLKIWVWVTLIAGFFLGGSAYNYDNGIAY